MGSPESCTRKKSIRPWRRLFQVVVLLVLIAVPYYSQNPSDWSPSRIVQGQMPTPATSLVSGDTWSFAIGDFRLTHPVAFVESWVSAKVIFLPLLISVLIPLGITVLLGRIFCSWLCPVGLLLELNTKCHAFLKKRGLTREIRIPDFRYVILALSLILGFVLAFSVISVFDPPHLLGRELMYLFTHQEVSLMGVGFLVGIVLFELLVTSRAWCSSFCPSGGGLSILGMKRWCRIRMASERCIHCGDCDAVCPYSLAPMNLADGKQFNWTKCENCGLCRDACPTGAISYSFGPTNKQIHNQTERGG